MFLDEKEICRDENEKKGKGQFLGKLRKELTGNGIIHNSRTQTNEIMKADSTTGTVISDIQENEYKHIQFHFGLSQREINAFKNQYKKLL